MQSEPDTEWIALPRVISIDDWHEPDYIRIARIQISLSENPDMPRLRQLLTGLRENLKTRLSQRQSTRGGGAALEGGVGMCGTGMINFHGPITQERDDANDFIVNKLMEDIESRIYDLLGISQ